MDAEALLRKYNPILVLLPQDPKRRQPWDRWWRKPKAERGDYHPCSAKFFLSNVIRRDTPRPWISEFLRNTPSVPPIPLQELKELVLRTDPEATRGWELDIAPIESQNAAQAWVAYEGMLRENASLSAPVAYGRWVERGGRIGLEYWYLYVYNDATNRHEGDWEMVAIELDANGAPVRAGYAGHNGGFQRDWPCVDKHEGRPVVYVARGSHAAYFEHVERGHRTNSLGSPKGWPEPIEFIWSTFNWLFQVAAVFLRLRDRTPTRPDRHEDESWNRGEFVCPELEIMPEIDDLAANPDFWWMRIRCRWGSRHSRILGTAAPVPPWEKETKWSDPVVWIDGTVEDR